MPATNTVPKIPKELANEAVRILTSFGHTEERIRENLGLTPSTTPRFWPEELREGLRVLAEGSLAEAIKANGYESLEGILKQPGGLVAFAYATTQYPINPERPDYQNIRWETIATYGSSRGKFGTISLDDPMTAPSTPGELRK